MGHRDWHPLKVFALSSFIKQQRRSPGLRLPISPENLVSYTSLDVGCYTPVIVPSKLQFLHWLLRKH